MGSPRRAGRPRAGEIFAVRKDWGGKFRVALVYPNRYPAGMSNLGFLLLYARINARNDALCERVFLCGAGERREAAPRRIRESSPPNRTAEGRSVESGRPLSAYDAVAVSLSYESDLLNLPAILEAGGVPPFREDRAAGGRRFPLVVAGGFAASLNPEPAGVFADAVVVGDGERAIESLIDSGPPAPADPAYLRRLASIPGVFVPAGYRLALDASPSRTGGAADELPALRGIEPLPGYPGRIAREVLDLCTLPPAPPVLLADDTELGSMSLVETSRGCPRMCGFCAAAHACPTFREFPADRVRAAIDAAWPYRRKVGLIGAAVLDWRPFRELAKEILDRGGAVSPASVRADLVDGEIADILARSGHRTVALAPECGDARLRARVGKRVPDETFFSAAALLARAGIVSYKLYFLLGLPGVGREDEVGGIARFLETFRERVLSEARGVGRMGAVTAVLSPFVPKPFTPLQWAPMTPERELRSREDGIRAALRRVPNLRFTASPPRQAIVQGFLGLSDRRVDAFLRMARAGKIPRSLPGLAARLDGVVFREKDATEFFPWDVIDGGPRKGALRARYEAWRES
ncbi:MAG: radical SAM protein [Deltaproteobacteria bacterium]